MSHSPRAFVKRLDFVTTLGHGEPERTARLGIWTKGPTVVIIDLCVLQPAAETRELHVTSRHPGVSPAEVAASTGWPVCFSSHLTETPPPPPFELELLRDLQQRTGCTHASV